MNVTEMPTRSLESLKTARPRSLLLLTIFSLLAIIAAACGSEATTATAEAEASVATTTPAVETTTEPAIDDETRPAPEDDVAAFTAAFGRGDADEAWSYHSVRCLSILPESYQAIVAGYAAEVPGATASNFSTEINGDSAAVSYDVHNGSGEYVESYISQPWIFSDGKWYRDAC